MNSEKCVIFNTIGSPIEGRYTGKGNPNAVLHVGRPLNRRQQALLDSLPEYDSRVTVRKCDVSMKDLAALTAVTEVEFAMFTMGARRLVIRGDDQHVNISDKDAALMSAQGYRWSGHTHPKLYDGLEFFASDEDFKILKKFDQKKSVIYNSKGMYQTFPNIKYKY